MIFEIFYLQMPPNKRIPVRQQRDLQFDHDLPEKR